MAGDSGVWMHAVVPDADDVALSGIPGMAGPAVRAVKAAGLTAVVSDVPLAEYGEQALRQNLEQLPWLERVARTHHAVVEELSHRGPVVPARLATIHNDDERVAGVLADRRDDLSAALDRLLGREEWGVKAYAVPTAPAEEQPVPGSQTGAAYLRRRKAQLTAHENGQQAAAEAASAVHTALTEAAVAARRHAPQDRRLTGAAAAMVLNGAYLIDREDVRGFTALAEGLAERNPAIRLELTGPWPAYSFVDDALVRVREPEEAA